VRLRPEVVAALDAVRRTSRSQAIEDAVRDWLERR
jgi:metal-responsive CopG/Arc/MetJ family transcriptional regulator